MNQKAFTLIELIVVIVILSLIALVVFPAVSSTIKSSRENVYESQKEIVIKAAKEYFLNNINELPDINTESPSYVSVQDLIGQAYISEEEVKDPRNNKPLQGQVKVTYESNQYIYEFVPDENIVVEDTN